MPVLETSGSQLVTAAGRISELQKPSMPLGFYSGGGSITLSGEGKSVSFAQLYRTQPWVATVINKLSRQIARLPLKVYEKDSQGNRKRVESGSLQTLLNGPWKRGSSMSLKQALAFPTVLHGNSLIAKERRSAGGPPTSLIPLDWRFIIPRYDNVDNSGTVVFWETNQSGYSQYLALEDVVHSAWWAPDGDVGVSPLQQLGTTIKAEDAAQRYASASFDNAARPSGALVAPPGQEPKPEEKKSLEEAIAQTHGGVDNAFKIMLLSAGMDWKQFGQTAKEAELIESRKLSREEICAVFDMAPPLVQILDKATFSNIDEQHLMLYKTVLPPWLELFEEVIQSQLIDPESAWQGQYVEFDLNEALRGVPGERIPLLSEGIKSGLYTINQAKKLENLPPSEHPWADEVLIESNNIAPLGEAPTSAQGREVVLPDPNATEEPSAEEETASDAAGPTLASHVARARKSVLSKAGAGDQDPFDAERFHRELSADLPDAGGLWAQGITDALAKGIAAAEGDKQRIAAFFDSLT
jgi:HK97 family phage portal protein